MDSFSVEFVKPVNIKYFFLLLISVQSVANNYAV